ncbi:unnamed protein product, partial [Rotaria sp. Silwood1]
MYCIFDVAFNGSPNSRTKTASIIPIEFATSWDLRVQFYPLTIIIVLPTLPFCRLSVLFILIVLHLVSIIVPIVMSIVNHILVENVIYWLLNIISPTINAQAIVTYILAQK